MTDSDVLEAAFDAATQFVGAVSANGSLTASQLLRFYGLFKQATAGAPSANSKPSIFDRRGRAKWNAWQSCGALSATQAQQQYINMLTELYPGWAGEHSSNGGNGRAKRGGAGGPVQSRMADALEEESEDLDTAPPLLQAARAGDAPAVHQLLQQGADPNLEDCEGATALHWAADRGHVEVLRLLLSYGAEVNATDCDGMSPLHYSALAEQEAAARLLAAAPGVCMDLRNNVGETPADVSPASWAFFKTELEPYSHA